jgi:hypothetical protein
LNHVEKLHFMRFTERLFELLLRTLSMCFTFHMYRKWCWE